MHLQHELLLDTTLDAYDHGLHSNADVYRHVASKMGINMEDCIEEIGRDKTKRNTFTRRVRWAMQTLKMNGLVEKIGYGQWRMTKEGKQTLTRIHTEKYMIAASTDLGVVIWGNSLNVFDKVITEDVHLGIMSPPYLGIVRSYGQYHSEDQYNDFLLKIIEPIRKRMVPGANLVLNVTNDSVVKAAFGERSLYLEKLILRLSSELDLSLMDRLPWHAPDKAPKSHQVTKARTHLVSKYEPCLWFCYQPEHCLADNRRVLVPYTDSMKKLIAKGGESRAYAHADYDANARAGSFSRDNGGSIPGNILRFPTHCNMNRLVQRHARALGLPVHGALFPFALASFLINWLCPEGGTVVDPCGGYSTSGLAAELNNRHWITCELHWEYIKPALLRFVQRPGYMVNPLFEQLGDPLIRQRFAA